MSLRCATYARYSTDKQNPLSIEDQLRKCREFAQHHGWEFLEDRVYIDEAITGGTDLRSSLTRLVEDACSSAHLFEIVLFDDTSRLSRRLADSLRISEQLSFAGVRLVFVSQGIDTNSEQAEILMATHGIVDSLYIKELAKKTHRGMEGAAIRGLHTGGRCYGYTSVAIEDETQRDPHGRNKIIGIKLQVNPIQAEIVRRIFEEYVAGRSLSTIAKGLNADRVASPMPYRGQLHPSWSPACIYVILHNERYRGRVIWNRTRKVRDPRTGRRINRKRPREEWKIQDVPGLRIVSEDLWLKVEGRFRTVRSNFINGARRGLCRRSFCAPYLLSGFLRCGLCGSSMTMLSGRGAKNWGKYGCPIHHERGACSNGLLINRFDLEREVLGGLQREVFREDMIKYAVREFERQLTQRLKEARVDIEGKQQRREVLKREIDNLAEAIAEGHRSSALLDQLTKRERELETISEGLLAANETGIQAKLEEIETFIRKRFADLGKLASLEAESAKAELAKHCSAITITPDGNSYTVSGEWDLVGVRWDGAGGQNRTGYARLFRAALYQ